MARASKITNHPNRKDMEKEYLQGKSIHSLAKQYQVDYQCLYRHLNSNRSGLSRQMAKSYELQSNTEGSELLEIFTTRIESLIEKLETVIDAMEGKDYPTMVSAVKELRQCLESQVKMLMTGRDAGIVSADDQQYQKQQETAEYQKLSLIHI